MTWINYNNINQFVARNGTGCKFCEEDKRKFLIKKGTLVDYDLLFLTYIAFIRNDDKVIEIGSYPFSGADLFYCTKCNSDYYQYFNEGHIGGRPEYQLIHSDWSFDVEKASCSIILSKNEINTLSEKFDVIDFKPHISPVSHTFRIDSNSLPVLASINQKEIERSSLIRYDLAGNRNFLHDFIRSAEELGKGGFYRRYVRLNKKLLCAIEQVQFENNIQLAKHILSRVRKEISNAVHDLSRFEYDKLSRRIIEYESCLKQIEVSLGVYSEEISTLLKEIRVCS